MEPFLVHVQAVDGRLNFTPEQKRRLNSFVENQNGQTLVFDLRPAPKEISNSLRGSYFGVWLPAILKEVGLENTKENQTDVHHALMLKFNPVIVKGFLNEDVTGAGSLSALNQEEFLIIIERIDSWFQTSYSKSLPEPKKQ
jgi:hypothetical protein